MRKGSGYERPATTAPKRERSAGEPQYGSMTCEWTRGGHNCRMPGAIKDGQSWFCAWHRKCLSMPSLISDYIEFTEFLKSRETAFEVEVKKQKDPKLLPRNPWRGPPQRLWNAVGGDTSDLHNASGHDRKSDAAGSDDDRRDVADLAANLADDMKFGGDNG